MLPHTPESPWNKLQNSRNSENIYYIVRGAMWWLVHNLQILNFQQLYGYILYNDVTG